MKCGEIWARSARSSASGRRSSCAASEASSSCAQTRPPPRRRPRVSSGAGGRRRAVQRHEHPTRSPCTTSGAAIAARSGQPGLGAAEPVSHVHAVDRVRRPPQQVARPVVVAAGAVEGEHAPAGEQATAWRLVSSAQVRGAVSRRSAASVPCAAAAASAIASCSAACIAWRSGLITRRGRSSRRNAAKQRRGDRKPDHCTERDSPISLTSRRTDDRPPQAVGVPLVALRDTAHRVSAAARRGGPCDTSHDAYLRTRSRSQCGQSRKGERLDGISTVRPGDPNPRTGRQDSRRLGAGGSAHHRGWQVSP